MNALLAKVPPPAMNDSIFAEKEFALLIVVSIVLPLALYAVMMLKKALSRAAVLVYGIILVVISGANVVLLQRLASMAKISLCTLDNQVFSSEISLALYLLPALFAGIGINIISHVIVSHLGDAQREFARPQAQAGAIDAGTPPAP
jgi:hypothetical protein